MSAVSAYTANREWATRPPDEQFDSGAALHAAACARRNRLGERTIETPTFRTEAVTHHALVLHDASLGATSKELGATRESVIETAMRRIDLSQEQASEACDLAERHETNPRSTWARCRD